MSTTAKVIVASRISATASVAAPAVATTAQAISVRTTPAGPMHALQYSSDPHFAGSENLLFYSSQNTLQISGGTLLIGSGAFRIDSSLANSSLFQIKAGTSNILNVDTSNKRITFSTNTSAGEYYVGIGTVTPTDKLHVVGNLKIEGNIYASGHIEPLQSGAYNLGSESKPFDNLYLKNPIIFSEYSIPSGIDEFFVGIGNLSYTPKVISTLLTPTDGDALLFSLERITSTGFNISLSKKTSNSGYKLEYLVSSNSLK